MNQSANLLNGDLSSIFYLHIFLFCFVLLCSVCFDLFCLHQFLVFVCIYYLFVHFISNVCFDLFTSGKSVFSWNLCFGHLQTSKWRFKQHQYRRMQRLKDIPTPVFSTPNFQPRIFKPQASTLNFLTQSGLFNP